MNDRSETDIDLWKRAQQREEAAFELLRRKYRALVRGEIRQRLQYVSEEDLHDLEQGIWIAVWNALAQFQGGCAFSTWVVAIAKNHIFTWLRRRRVEQQATVRLTRESETQAAVSEEMAVDRMALLEAMQHLMEAEKKVIYLRYFAQLTDEEVSIRLGMPLGTAKKRIRTGMEKLRTHLQTRSKEPET